MARQNYEGKYRIYWGDAPADKSAPTTTEIGAATDVTSFFPKDGLSHSTTKAKVAFGDLASGFDPEGQGSWSFTTEGTIYRDDVTDDAWDLWTTHAQAGALYILPFKGSDAIAASDPCMVIVGEASIATPLGTTPNAKQKASVDFTSTEEPDFNAVVAAGV